MMLETFRVVSTHAAGATIGLPGKTLQPASLAKEPRKACLSVGFYVFKPLITKKEKEVRSRVHMREKEQ